MCTATWLAAGGELRFLFNRDELRSRARGLPPVESVADRVRYLAPRDGEAQGTWIAATERGVLLALLNRTDAGVSARRGAVSRGSIIPRLASAADTAEVESRLRRLELSRSAPFRLFGRDDSGAPPLCWGWNGEILDRAELDLDAGILCSSGLGDRRVTSARTPHWRALRDSPEGLSLTALRRFHRSHQPERSADSVCMHRDDAQSVSHTEATIDGAEVSLAYVDGPPCEGSPATTVRIPRAADRPR